ncbi:hypothetical protein KVF89_09535 [Nocardioides carbamazepini]|uniref:hypothetical protein n=1 Tax=Nocardioides carbamazepini TaxID=2854259 RepID=UPI002149EC5C|nr:hypothetical protein [Nocardioides carbamazepini]MCR1782774.1 hypothetical protein [Nocardioides carbamazepini]
MRRRLVPSSAVVALTAFLLALLGLVGSPASADPYTPAVPTSCRVTVPATVAGDRVVVRVQVTAAGSVQPKGTVTVDGDRVSARAAAADRWTRTVRYEGSTVELVGPRLERGRHQATATFVPDDPTRFGRCSDSVKFQVDAEGETGGGNGGSSGGGLPNTGGPHLGFLLAGIGLVAVGGGLAERARRT